MNIDVVIKKGQGEHDDVPTKRELIQAVNDAMTEVGVSKHIWLKTLELPEEDFDEVLKKACDRADHIAKGDKIGRAAVLDDLMRELMEEDDDDERSDD